MITKEYSDVYTIKKIATLIDEYGPFTMAVTILLIDRFGPFDNFHLAKEVATYFDTLASAEKLIYEVDPYVTSVEVFLEYLSLLRFMEKKEDSVYE